MVYYYSTQDAEPKRREQTFRYSDGAVVDPMKVFKTVMDQRPQIMPKYNAR